MSLVPQPYQHKKRAFIAQTVAGIAANARIESAFGGPEPPMRRADHNPFTTGSLGPAARSPPAGEDQWMHPIPVDHRELEVALVGGG